MADNDFDDFDMGGIVCGLHGIRASGLGIEDTLDGGGGTKAACFRRIGEPR